MSIYDYHGNIISADYIALEPQENDIPIVTIDGELPETKSQGELNVMIAYNSLTAQFKDYATLKVQGDSSTGYPKKNFTVKLFSNAERTVKDKRTFRDWTSANKFVLKANWIDHSHARNIVNARLWKQVVESRSDFDSLPDELKSGHIAIDGFPVKVFANGIYMGIYTWNVPKDALYGLKDSILANAIVQGQANNNLSTLWRSSTMSNWDDETHDSMPTVISNGFAAALNFVYTSSDANFVNNFTTYFDKQSIIDQYIFLYVGCIVDNIGKNQTFFTYNGSYWYGGMYDMDGTWGLPPFYPFAWLSSSVRFQEDYSAYKQTSNTTNLLYERVGTLFESDVITRYAELRASVLSADNINAEFERFMSVIPPYLYAEDYAATTGDGDFTDIPLKDTNNVQQIRQFVVDRLAYVDSMILPSEVTS